MKKTILALLTAASIAQAETYTLNVADLDKIEPQQKEAMGEFKPVARNLEATPEGIRQHLPDKGPMLLRVPVDATSLVIAASYTLEPESNVSIGTTTPDKQIFIRASAANGKQHVAIFQRNGSNLEKVWGKTIEGQSGSVSLTLTGDPETWGVDINGEIFNILNCDRLANPPATPGENDNTARNVWDSAPIVWKEAGVAASGPATITRLEIKRD